MVSNNQLIQADGGTVILTASAASALNSAVISNTGIIEARTINNQNGQIELLADSGQVTNTGTLDVSATAGQNAGSITEQANNISENGTLNASGDTGGQITLQAMNNIDLSGSQIHADGNNGDGGSVTVVAFGSVSNNTGATAISAEGSNNGGNINITANNGININNATVLADGSQGNGGVITITDSNISDTDSINSSTLSANGAANGGNITINAGQAYLDSDTINSNGGINGGTIQVSADSSLLTNNTLNATGQAGGTISLNDNSDLYLDNNQITATGTTVAGNINAQSYTLEYWTTNNLNAAAGVGAQDPVQILSANQTYSLLPTSNILQFGNQQYVIQPGDALMLSNPLTTNHIAIAYAPGTIGPLTDTPVANNPIVSENANSTNEYQSKFIG